jgi:two-component system sensor histidine kinase BaeS
VVGSFAADTLLAQTKDSAMMDDGASASLFVVMLIAVALAAAFVIPLFMKRLPLKQAVPALAFVGPLLAVIGSLLGSGAMTLSGHDAGYVALVALLAGLAAFFVGWRVSRPLARDLDRVAVTLRQVAQGDRSARCNIERTDELAEVGEAVDELTRSLVRAEAERSAADAERRAVVSALSHDLRTPLASLLASVDALDDGVADGPTHIRAMRSNVMALDHLVEDLFLLARADSGQLGLQVEPMDLSEMIDEAVEAVTPSAANSGVKLLTDTQAAVEVDADHTALGRLLRNLLDNAVRYSPIGGTVRVSTTRTSGSDVTVAITDEGPGFPPDFIPHAFDRFSQADPARSSHGGAGLGLAIASTLAEALGGSISIDSGPGGKVSFCLPTNA